MFGRETRMLLRLCLLDTPTLLTLLKLGPTTG